MENPVIRLLLAGALAIALACVLTILAIQVIEFRFYGGPPESVWPQTKGSAAVAAPAVQPVSGLLSAVTGAAARATEETTPAPAVTSATSATTAAPDSAPAAGTVAAPAEPAK